MSHPRSFKSFPIVLLSLFVEGLAMSGCSGVQEHMAPAVNDSDSLPFMRSVGVSTLISDSGVIRYHLVAEEWDIFTYPDKQATWKFRKGLLMTRFDDKFHVDLYVQADTAYLFEQYLWELRGRVRVRNVEGTYFQTQHLWWDLNQHEMWNHCSMIIESPERTLHGTEFRSNEDMTRYTVVNSVGDFPMSDSEGESQEAMPDQTLRQEQSKGIKLLPPAPAKRGLY